MKLTGNNKSTRKKVFSLTSRTLALSLTALIVSAPILKPMAATLNGVQQGKNNPKLQVAAPKNTTTKPKTVVSKNTTTKTQTAAPKGTATKLQTAAPKSTAAKLQTAAPKSTAAKIQAVAPKSTAAKFYEFKINPPKDGTYTDKRTGFKVTVHFDYQKGEAKKVTWSSNYPVYSVLVKGGEKGGNLFKHDGGSVGGTEVITPDNKGIGHGHAIFYYCVSNSNPIAPAPTPTPAPAPTPAPTEPTAPATTDPTAPAATEPTAPAATEPTAPATTDPTAPATTDPTAPAATEPTAPATTDPTAPAATEPTAPATTDPTAPAATEPTAPATTEPTAPATTDPTAPAATEPTAPATTDPTAPAATEPTAPAATDPTAPATTEPTAPATTNPTAPAATQPLSVISMSQTSGLVTGGDYVTVNGTGFQQGLTVTLGGLNATVVNYYSDNQIRIAIPQAVVEGAADLIVTNPDGQAATLASAYTYLSLPATPPPTITSLSSTSGVISGGEYVTVTGTGFQKGLTATLGGLNATVVNYYSDTQIRIAIPQVSAEGAVDLIVTNPDGQATTLASAYTYLPLPATPPPTITSLAKATGLTSGGDYVIINGTGFQQGLTVKLGGLDAQVANFYSSTQIRIIIPKVTNPGVVDLEVTNPDGQSALLSSAYTYNVPVVSINSLSANSGDFSGGYYIFINGVNFDPSSTVTVNNVPVSIYYYSSTQIKILSMPSADTVGLSNAGGIVPIKVTDSLGNSVTANFTYNAKPAALVPVITKMVGAGGAAATGSIAGGTYMYFYGTGFTSTMKVRIYDSSNILVKEDVLTNFYNSGYVRYVMPKVATAGNYTVKLVNIDGVESNGMTYIYK